MIAAWVDAPAVVTDHHEETPNCIRGILSATCHKEKKKWWRREREAPTVLFDFSFSIFFFLS